MLVKGTPTPVLTGHLQGCPSRGQVLTQRPVSTSSPMLIPGPLRFSLWERALGRGCPQGQPAMPILDWVVQRCPERGCPDHMAFLSPKGGVEERVIPTLPWPDPGP
jgi:hypothetical protein